MNGPRSHWVTAAGWLAWIVVGLAEFISTATAAPLQCEPACPSQLLAAPTISDSATNLRFQGIFAARKGDPRAFVLLGSGFIRALSFGDPGVFVKNWLAAHPRATYTPISTLKSTNTKTHRKFEITYIWIEDGQSALNVDLIRQGIFIGAVMCDMVENARGLDRLLQNDPKLAYEKSQIDRERAAAPDDRAERLVSESSYKARLARIRNAEHNARAEKLGIWSDGMRAEREAEGVL